MAASEAAKESIYLARFLKELGVAVDGPVELGMDNQSAIAISYNPELHSRTKHIDRRHFFVRECVENHQLTIPFVKTVDNLADFFTKPLPAKTFFAMRDQLMNCAPQQGALSETTEPSRAAVADSRLVERLLDCKDKSPRQDPSAKRRMTFATSVDLELCRRVRRQHGCHHPRALHTVLC